MLVYDGNGSAGAGCRVAGAARNDLWLLAQCDGAKRLHVLDQGDGGAPADDCKKPSEFRAADFPERHLRSARRAAGSCGLEERAGEAQRAYAKLVYYGKIDFGVGGDPTDNLLVVDFVQENTGWSLRHGGIRESIRAARGA